MKKYFISFGNGKFKNQLNRVCNEAKETGWFDGVIADTPSTIKDFIDKHKDFINNNPRGFGYWIWKPFIILDQLNKMNDGDCLFYTDAGSKILPHRENRFNEYINILKKQPIWINGEGGQYNERQYQKISLLKKFNLENDEQFLSSSHTESGMIAVRKCKESLSIIQKWLDLVVDDNYNLVNDKLSNDKQLEGFIEHRHDQSILNILLKTKGYEFLWYSNCYGLGPFFSSRRTDTGMREFAADWWRAEPDYIDNITHPTRFEYLNSKIDPNWWKKQKDYDPNKMFVEDDYMHYRWKEYNHS
jgi:hypothetical protein|tara:strand:+ start:989 stop:1891 length:903 start_codon:yes stop_codon:yes gene_type:complete